MVAALGSGGDGSSIIHPSCGLFDVLKSPYFGAFFLFYPHPLEFREYLQIDWKCVIMDFAVNMVNMSVSLDVFLSTSLNQCWD